MGKGMLPTSKDMTFYMTKAGDRTISPAQRRKFMQSKGFRCEICKKKFDKAFLDVHHKKEVARHKDKYINLPIMTLGYKHKPKYDKESNLQLLCKKCHKEHHSIKTKKETAKRKAKGSDLFGNYDLR